MRLGDLFDEGVPPGAQNLAIEGLTADSRKVAPGFLFAALQGAAAHGRDFVAQAVAQGATAVLSAGDLAGDPGAPHVIAADPRQALAIAASRFYPRQPEVVCAVTGTNGKSSTVDFLRQIWAVSGLQAASLGTLGAIGPRGAVDLGHTTPDPVAIHATLQALADEGVSHAAMEASSHGLDQRRLDGVRLAVGAFTNLTQDHLDYHRDMDAYRAAKLRLWELLPPGAPAVVCMDPRHRDEAERFEAAARARGLAVLTCGHSAADLKIIEIAPRPNGQSLLLRWNGADTAIELPLIGEFQALNAVTAAAMALAAGLPATAAFRAMAGLKPVRGRIEHVGATEGGAHVFVDYAHTPDGLEVLLRAARPHAPGRLVLVFGCGGDRDRGKRPKMGEIAARLADVAIVTDDNPRSEDPSEIRADILRGMTDGGADIREVAGRREAIQTAVAMLRPGDAALIAGKGHETGQIIKGVTYPFSDQDEARAALESRR